MVSVVLLCPMLMMVLIIGKSKLSRDGSSVVVFDVDGIDSVVVAAAAVVVAVVVIGFCVCSIESFRHGSVSNNISDCSSSCDCLQKKTDQKTSSFSRCVSYLFIEFPSE